MREPATWGVVALGVALSACMRMGFNREPEAAVRDGSGEPPIDLAPERGRELPRHDAVDLARLDLGGRDLGQPDRKPDAQADQKKKPDLPAPDLKKQDLQGPDQKKPDAQALDQKKLDVQPPDLAKPDLSPIPGVWIAITKGSFTMGSPAGEPCNTPDETQHLVTLTHNFELASTEVRQTDFAKLLGYNPSNYTSCGASCPVESVSWHEAASYCNALSALVALPPCYSCSGSGASVACAEAASYTGAAFYNCPGYRLPTEAEWEFAYRAGTTTGLYNGEITANCNATDPKADLIAWYNTTSTHPAAQKQANPWGLYDMAGNVWEWTHDLFQNNLGSLPVVDPIGAPTGTGRVYRGGSYFYGLKYLRAAYRAGLSGTARSNDIGFRCARSR